MSSRELLEYIFRVSEEVEYEGLQVSESLGYRDEVCDSKNQSVRLILADAAEGLKAIEDGTVKCIVTSPPYFWLRDYGIDGQIGKEDSIDDYVNRICAVMMECYRVLSDDGVLFLNLGDTYYSGRGESRGVDKKNSKRRFGLRAVDRGGGLGKGLKSKTVIGIPWRVAIAMIESGWILRSPIIWNRVSALPEAVKDRPKRQFEYLFMFVKSRKYHFNRDYFNSLGEQDVWSIAVGSKNDKTNTKSAPFPAELAVRCINIASDKNDTILDPFMGIGTTLIAARECGRNSIGIDLSEDAYETVLRRIRET